MELEIGTYLQIPLKDGSYAYGRVLWEPYMAFYNLKTAEPTSDLDLIDTSPVLFRQAVRLPKKMKWINIGHRQLSGELTKPVVLFMQSLADYKECVIFDSDGEERSATPEECIGLERAEVWDAEHIEERMFENLEGRISRMEMYARVQLS